MANYGNNNNNFNLCINILRTQYGLHQAPVQLCNTLDEQRWRDAKFWVFDAPSLADKSFEV